MVSKRDILEISCKVLGLFCLIRGMAYFFTPMMFWNLDNLVFFIGPFVSSLVLSFVLLRWSRNIAQFLIREDQPMQLGAEEGWQKPVYTLCIRVIGAFAFIRAVPEIIRALSQLVFLLFRSESPSQFPDSRFLYYAIPVGALVWAIVYLSLGIYFIRGAKGITRIAMKGSMREQNSDNT